MATAKKAELDNKATEPTRINRWAVGSLLTIAALIGLAPVTLIQNRPQLLIYIFVVVALLVGLRLRFGNFPVAATYEPSFPELLLSGLSALFLWAAVGLIWLSVYGLIYWVTKLVQFLAMVVGMHVQLNADIVAFYPAGLLAVVFVLSIALESVSTSISQLYPDIAGTRSVFYKLVIQGRGQLLRSLVAPAVGLLVLVAIFLVIWFFTSQIFTPGIYIALQFYLLYASSPVGDLVTDTPPKTSNATQAISELLKAIGYKVIAAPRTGNSETDPLLVNLDMFAYNSERAFAIEIKTAQQSTASVGLLRRLHKRGGFIEIKTAQQSTASVEVEWTVASSLLMAAMALDKEAQELGVKSEKVEPVIVLIGTKPADSLKAFCQKESVQIIPIPNEHVIDKILETDNQAGLRQLAQQHLVGIFDASDDAGTASSKPGGLEGEL